MQINLIHKEMTDEECYQKIKSMHKENPIIVMNPDKWKKLRLQDLKKDWRIQAVQKANSNKKVNKKTLKGLKEYRQSIKS